MWTRREIKNRATVVIVCFIWVVFMGAHSSFNSRIDAEGHPRSNFQAPTNTEVVNNIIGSFNDGETQPVNETMGIKAPQSSC